VLASFASDKGATFVPVFDIFMQRQQNGKRFIQMDYTQMPLAICLFTSKSKL
jgi:hypothetical protein